MSISPDDILADIPGWEGARYTKLRGGLTNVTWHVVHEARAGVLKIDEDRREHPLNSRSEEATIQTNAANAGLAPKVILAREGMYFAEYIEGTVWKRGCFDTNANLEELALALKRVHSMPLTGRSFDAIFAAKRYTEESRGLDADTISRCTDVIERMRKPLNLCCCHNDLVAENLISTPELMFLDWEYACDNDPFFDLATVAEHHELTDSQVVLFLDAYFDGDGRRWRDNLERYRKLYLALVLLWMASLPESDADEVKSVAERFATSYS
jgi:thiamine kinase-like enzyme